jgi:hypothetical protein
VFGIKLVFHAEHHTVERLAGTEVVGHIRVVRASAATITVE